MFKPRLDRKGKSIVAKVVEETTAKCALTSAVGSAVLEKVNGPPINVDEKREKLQEARAFLCDEKDKGWPNEKEAFDAAVDNLFQESIENENKVRRQELQSKYKSIDLGFLSMKRENPDKKSRTTDFLGQSVEGGDIVRLPFVPVFSCHKLRTPQYMFEECKILIQYGKTVKQRASVIRIRNYSLPTVMMNNVSQAIKHGMGNTRGDGDWYAADTTKWAGSCKIFKELMSISHTFTGIIPPTVKENIQKADESKDFDSIYLIKECPNWATKEITKDPIIVGIKGEDSFLIDHFDCTDVESYVRKEFTL